MVLQRNDEIPDEELDKLLRSGLGRVPAPASLKARILANSQRREERKKKLLLFRNPMFLRVAAAMLIAAFGLGIYEEHEHQRRLEGERAKEQVMLALRITGSALQTVQSRVTSGHRMQEEER